MENILYYGDNLDILRHYIKNESIDLIYLDPPFKSNQDYNIFFPEPNGTKSTAQAKAFKDTWSWTDSNAPLVYQEIIETGPQDISIAIQSLRKILKESDMMAYLVMMAPRLIELRRVLKDTGSVYLHCDPTASHYLKILMDAIFGPENFLNEIIWHYRKWPSGKYTFQRNHDIILFYCRSQSKDRTFNQLYMPRAASTLKRFGTSKIVSGYDENGHRLPSQVAEEDSAGVRQDDVWDIGRVPPIKQLFPTEKPLPLLEMIIRASSNEGDIVLDPFCGCGTTIIASQVLKRKWIGIDITTLAMTHIKNRLQNALSAGITYEVIGEPVTLTEAAALAKSDRYQFQWWALGLVGARPTDKKKGADKGIDGRLYFHIDPNGKETKQIILSVKSGNIIPNHVRDLIGVVNRENADIGVLITLRKPTRPMKEEASTAGFFKSPWGKHPKIQILTIKDLLSGKRIDFPPSQQVNITYKKAPIAKKFSISLNLPYEED